MKRNFILLASAGLAVSALVLTACTGSNADPRAGGSSDGTLTIDSWRTEDATLWEQEIIPAFNKAYPDIEVAYNTTKNTDYDAALETRLAGGTAADIVACRPYDRLSKLTDQGYLEPLSDVTGLSEFSDLAVSAWSSDEGTPYCMPVASVTNGFYYNKAIFKELGLSVPKTMDEFNDVLAEIAADGTYTPLAWGIADPWPITQMAMAAIGPNYWQGEAGRESLIDGSGRFTDPQFVDAFTALDGWKNYFPQGYEAVAYADMQQLFTLGRAAIFPGGSWEITGFEDSADFEIGVFPAPLPTASADTCYVTNHADTGFGINAASKNKEAARTFVSWLATTDFAEIYGNALPGFFPLLEEDVKITDPLAKEFTETLASCDGTERLTDQYLNAGTPNTEHAIREQVIKMWTEGLAPADAAENVQSGLDSWYTPKN